MELLHCEKLRKQKIELEKAEMDLVSVSDVNCAEGACHWGCASLFHIFQGEYEFSPEILSGKLAEVVYRDAAGKIQGREFKLLLALGHYRYLNFLSWLDEMRILFYELYCLTDCIIDTFSSTKCSFFLICPTEAEFVISLLYIAAIFDFTKDLQELILQEWAAGFQFFLPYLRATPEPPTTLMFLLLFHCFTACRLITHKTA